MGAQESEISALADLDDVIRGFLSRNEFLHEFRLQKLIYLAELVAQKEHERRLTDADYKPFMFGAYSEDVSNQLEDIESEANTRAATHHGKVVTEFLDPDQEPETSSEVEDILDKVQNHVQAKKISSKDFGQWSKESWLYENTPFEREMSFERYQTEARDALDEDLDPFGLT
ncbi:DUF4065 domain-containing protein [Halomicrobium mukohataei]|uniref:DUF4065 domain-containing protein n=1 Tax=Halomicrobium mukohataei TaxID=57705 RepID=A0A847UHX0_9EURY|nr:type II toxin-antitoxin system antitoxin SocA domain-containing protein [Halomicrobium mukohataei]NLV10698.1 DUF4065 domain-containing protein [Halomicrobium mukohataei]